VFQIRFRRSKHSPLIDEQLSGELRADAEAINVKRICGVLSALLLTVCLGDRGIGQQNNNDSATSAPLTLTGAIPLPNVQGRIDHFGFDPKNRLFVSALGNDSEEVISLGAQRVVHSIAGVPTPQGVVVTPLTQKVISNLRG
jgi:hypothetical protein